MPNFSGSLNQFLLKQAGLGSSIGGLFKSEGAAKGVGQALGRTVGKTHAEKAVEYTLKPAHDTGPLMKAFHYGATPFFLSTNVISDYKGIKDAKKLDPRANSPVNLTDEQVGHIKRRALNKARGRAIGDAASWAAFPLSFRSTPLNIAVGLGTGIGLPAAGEAIGGKL